LSSASPGSELRRLRALVGDLDAVVWEADASSGRFTFVSEGASEILGYPAKVFLHEPSFWADHIHPDDREAAVKEFMAGLAEGRPHDTEYRFLKPRGDVVWVRDIGHAVTDMEGKPVTIRGLMVDVTQQKLAEEHRAEVEQRYRLLVERLPGIVYIEDADPSNVGPGRFTYVSQAIERILGYTVQEWLADPTGWIDRLHPDDLPTMRRAYEGVIPTGAPYAADYRMFAKDGHIVWIHDEAVLVRDEEGLPLYWQGVMLDVSEQRRADRRAEDTEARYRSLVEHLPAVAYTESVRDEEGGVIYVSPQVRSVLGVEPATLVGSPDHWLSVIHPEDRDLVAAANDRSNETGEPYLAEYRMLRPDGSQIWIHDESVLVRDEDGNPRFWQGVMLDITERRRTEELERALATQREEAAELRALDELKNTFLQAVSHDLRTPLAAILGLAVTLERQDGLDGEEARDLAARIAANARKLDRMVTDLLDLDRISRGIVEPKVKRTDLSALVRRVMAESEVVVDREIVLDVRRVIAAVDPAKVERIVENLLSNALRHTPPGSRIWVRVSAEGDGALLTIEDDGPGVAPEHRADIFQPFRQGAGAPEHSPGVGIGLALVARFAELHGGRAWVQDREGGGASFRVWLPVAGPAATEG